VAPERPSADFTWRIRVPIDAPGAGAGVVTITSGAIFRPWGAGSADRRELEWRLFEVTIAR